MFNESKYIKEYHNEKGDKPLAPMPMVPVNGIGGDMLIATIQVLIEEPTDGNPDPIRAEDVTEAVKAADDEASYQLLDFASEARMAKPDIRTFRNGEEVPPEILSVQGYTHRLSEVKEWLAYFSARPSAQTEHEQKILEERQIVKIYDPLSVSLDGLARILAKKNLSKFPKK